MAEGTAGRGGRLSGLIPLVVVGIIVFLFFRSCFQGIPSSIPFFGSDEDSEEDSDPPPLTPDQPDDSDAPDEADTSAMTRPRDPECPDENGEDERHLQWTEAPPMCIDPTSDYTATLHTDRGDIVIELETDTAPVTVNNFVFLARWRFYDGVRFHAIFPDDNLQAGDPIGDPPGTGGPGYNFEGELPTQEPRYPLYSVAMGNEGSPDTNASEFFIVTGTGAAYPQVYSRFGHIRDTNSQAVVEDIDDTGVRLPEGDGAPKQGQTTVIESVTITET